jgi:ParB family chromosome partitioning protein
VKPQLDKAAKGIAQPLRVPLAALAPDPDQPRQTGVDQDLDPLVASLRAHGIIHPLLVRPHPQRAAREGTPYMIVVGERRWTAAGRAGLQEVPVFLLDRELSAAERLMVQLEENDGDNRQELTLWDLATATARAFTLSGLSQADFSRQHGKSNAWLSYRLSLARAQGVFATALREGHLRGSLVARTFQRLTAEQQQELLDRARKDRVPVSLAAAEKLAARLDERSPRPRRAGAAFAAAEAGAGRAGGGRRDRATGYEDGDEDEDENDGGDDALGADEDAGLEAGDPEDDDAGDAAAVEPRPHPRFAQLLPARPAPAARPGPASPPTAEQPRPAPQALAAGGGAPRSATASLLGLTRSYGAADPSAGDAGDSVIADTFYAGAHGADRAAAGDRVTFTLTLAQLQHLLRRLGLEPAATAQALVQQLLTVL